jgi:gamma-glutamyltranspeptidase / glutathione hydrolase
MQVLTECGHGVAATAFPGATEAACEMLRAGGNAVDAAAAAAWALSVCEPSSSGLGGQTTMLVRLSNKRATVIDGHSYAPALASRSQINSSAQDSGYRACVIPSTPATLGYASRTYGRLSVMQVMTPAIRLAEEGYRITPLQSRQLRWCRTALLRCPAAAMVFLREGEAYESGEVFRQPRLAATLRRLAAVGVDDFYRGEVAQAVVADMCSNDGLIVADDLESFALPVERDPIGICYRGFDVLSVPPPGGGAQLLYALKLLESLTRGHDPNNTDEWYCTLAEVVYATFAEREQRPVHPAHWSAAVFANLMATAQQPSKHATVGDDRQPRLQRRAADEVGETTHLCTADNEGNVVSLTQSIQSLFGAKVANGRLGFLYNNYLTTCPRRVHPYRLNPRCMARSNAAPTLVIGNEGSDKPETVLAVGAAGSRRILTAILQVISGVVDRGLSLERALAMPRAHALLSRKVWIEQPAINEAVQSRLQARFTKVEVLRPNSYTMGAAQAVQVQANGSFVGAADPRRDGSALVV